jgi:dihydroorotate dehydrogenase
MFILIRQLIFKLSPETAHHVTMSFLRFLTRVPGAYPCIRFFSGIRKHQHQVQTVAGISFPNIIGLAAGFDKDAQYLSVWKALGFGHVEIGTLTPLAQEGNEQPRLFRLPMDMALINRMGFNNKGVDAAIEHLKNRPEGLIVGGNIGKNKNTPKETAFMDYLVCFDKLYAYVDYFTVNISSPNTPGLRDLQTITELEIIIQPLLDKRKEKQQEGLPFLPIFVKLAPDLALDTLTDLITYINQTEVDGIVMTNTTISREGLKTPFAIIDHIGNGGLSGAPLFEKSTDMLSHAKSVLSKDKYIIGVGGIYSGNDALQKREAGAHLLQVYSGFVYKGPSLIGSVLK